MSRRSRRFRQKEQTVTQQPGKHTSWLRILPWVFFVLAYVNVAAASYFYPLDYDLGWHLKYGQDVVENHFISSVNTYSADMPGHRWINSSWLSDVLRYLLFHMFSFQGLMVAGIVTMILTFYFFAAAGKLTWWDAILIFPFIAYLEIPLTSASFRAQLLSLTGMGVIIWILRQYQHGHKDSLYFLLPLFFLWANLHGGFFLGILYIGAWVVLYIIQEVYIAKSERLFEAIKRHGTAIGLALAGSLLVTLINPWGWELYAEHILVDFTSRFDTDPSQFLVEWKPLYDNSGLLINHVFAGIVYAVSLGFAIWKKRYVTHFPLLVLTTLMYLAAFSSRRFAWTMYFLSIPVLSIATDVLKPKKTWVAALLAGFISLGFFVYIWNKSVKNIAFLKTDWFVYCQMTGCSPSSAEFLVRSGLTNSVMYTTYDWGGWLIWNYPQIVPLVDGRMSTWVDENGYNAFLDYIQYENDWKNIDESRYEVVYLSPGKRALFNRLLKLVEEGKWTIAYRDNFAYVFVRNRR